MEFFVVSYSLERRHGMKIEQLQRTIVYLVLFFWVFIFNAAVISSAQTDLFKDYSKKKITFIVPFGPGGGYDTIARTIVPYIGKYTGAKVILRNVTGAGGLNGMNTLWKARPNGYTIGLVTGIGACLNQIAGSRGARFDVEKFTWFGRISPNFFSMAGSPKGQLRSMKDIINSDRSLKIGTTGASSALTIAGRMLAKAYGFKVDFVLGYGSTGEIYLGVIRGDIDIAIGAADSVLNQVKAGTLHPLFYLDMKKGRGYPDTPSFNEIKPAKTIYAKAISNLGDMGRLIAGPPKIKKDKTTFLQNALWKALKDPNFVSDAKKLNHNVEPAPAETVAKLIHDALNAPPEIKAVIKEAFKK
jgi:tripartite-type tricarboxylate transporter receptor subunit TctC